MAIGVEKKGKLSERVRRLKEALLQAPGQLSCERIKFLMEVYRETEGEPEVIRRAKVLERVLTRMAIFLDENPIVGTLTQYRGGVQPYPEYSCKWMLREPEFSGPLGKVKVSEEDSKLTQETVAYWADKCVVSRTKRILVEKYGEQVDRDAFVALGVWSDGIGSPMGRVNVDYGRVLNQGLSSIIEEAEKQFSQLPVASREAIKKRHFLKAVIIALNAAIKFAQRYATLAEDRAKVETNPERKAELAAIAETCRWVPAKPARNFREALQAFWFTHLVCIIERASSGYSPGRFSQYMYPFYSKDVEEGRINPEQVIELLQLLFIRFTEIARYDPGRFFEESMGSQFQNISLGGVTPEGGDATNELDFLLLEAQKRVRLIQPTLSILYHDKLPPELVLKAAEVVRTGIGMPAFFNNDVNIQCLLSHGASLEDARNHCIIGCVEVGFSHSCSSMWGGFVNVAKMLELALNHGKDPLSGKQLGPPTGEAGKFHSYEELEEAVKKQLLYFMPRYAEFEYTAHAINGDYLPVPFCSALIDGCIESGKDMNEGGTRYSMHGFGPVGIVDLGDSLAAIKKLVFEEKRMTMKELLAALRANFEGHEDLQQALLKAPKYGNDDDYVDQIVKKWYSIFFDEQSRYKDQNGRATRAFAISITTHYPLGARTGALPSGRKTRLPLTDGSVSAHPGQDKNGPTALIRSATKVLDCTKYAANLLNMKFHPAALQGIEGLTKLNALVKTYMDLGGHHVQFNVVSAETLKDAQRHPENYRDLIVRVAGFSAYFVNLDPGVQEEIIRRTELRSI